MQQARFLTGIAVVATSCAVMMLFTTDWLLQRWLQNITVETKSDIISNDERIELQHLINEITKLLDQAESIMQDQTHPLSDIVTIISPTPDDIQLHDYTVDYVTHRLELSGIAETRDALVAYQPVISTIPGVSNAYLPLQDITSKEEVPFIIQTTYETTPVDATE